MYAHLSSSQHTCENACVRKRDRRMAKKESNGKKCINQTPMEIYRCQSSSRALRIAEGRVCVYEWLSVRVALRACIWNEQQKESVCLCVRLYDLKCVNVLRRRFDGFVFKCFKSQWNRINCFLFFGYASQIQLRCVCLLWSNACNYVFFSLLVVPFWLCFFRSYRIGCLCCCRAVALPSYTVALLSYLCVRFFLVFCFAHSSPSLAVVTALNTPFDTNRE